MRNDVKLAFILLLSSILLLGCGSDSEDSAGQQNAGNATNNESSENETENDNSDNDDKEDNSSESETVLTELHSFTEEDDIEIKYISINYDGSIVTFDHVDKSGEDKVTTPYFIYDDEVIDASSVDTFTDCSFHSIDEKSTSYSTGKCKDESGDRVSVVYDVTDNTITHSADRDKILTPLADGRVLATEEYDGDSTIYELTEDGEETFLAMGDMTTVLDISADQQGEVFFISGANDDYWNAYIYDTTNDSEPVLFEEVPDDDDATTVEGEISPDGKYIMYRYRGVSGGKHYNYADSYIFDRETEEEISLGHGFDVNFVRPNGYVFDEVRKYGQVIFNMDSSKWLGPDEKDFSFIDSMYVNEYVDEEERDALITSNFMAISGDGETIVTLDKFRGSEDEEDYLKIQTLKTEDYIRSLEDQDVEIDFEPSPFDEKGA